MPFSMTDECYLKDFVITTEEGKEHKYFPKMLNVVVNYDKIYMFFVIF